MSAESEAARAERRTLSPLAVAVLVVVVVGLITYIGVGLAYAASVSYETPGGNWLESLLNLGIRVAGWPVLLATHQ